MATTAPTTSEWLRAKMAEPRDPITLDDIRDAVDAFRDILVAAAARGTILRMLLEEADDATRDDVLEARRELAWLHQVADVLVSVLGDPGTGEARTVHRANARAVVNALLGVEELGEAVDIAAWAWLDAQRQGVPRS